MQSSRLALAVLGVLAVAPSAAGAAAPAPCGGIAQIGDLAGDGHHGATDVVAAWWSEANGRLQAVIQIRVAGWAPEHDDAEVNGSGYALVFTSGGARRYVRVNAPPAGQGAVTYDYGAYVAPAGFTSAGSTTGELVYGTNGTATVDVPAAAFGLAAGAVLANPVVLTYDGVTGGVPDWVDHAPGGVLPGDPSLGADYVLGSCVPTPPPGDPGTPTPDPGAPAPTTTAVQLQAPRSLLGGGVAVVSGRVVPARGGVTVTLTRRTGKTRVDRVTTAADGTFRARLAVRERTRLRAEAEGIRSQELTVGVRSTVRITVRRLASGVTLVSGTTRPALPGRILWLRTTAVAPSRTRAVSGGSFSLRFADPAPGRYQIVFIPSGARAERSTSNVGVIR